MSTGEVSATQDWTASVVTSEGPDRCRGWVRTTCGGRKYITFRGPSHAPRTHLLCTYMGACFKPPTSPTIKYSQYIITYRILGAFNIGGGIDKLLHSADDSSDSQRNMSHNLNSLKGVV